MRANLPVSSPLQALRWYFALMMSQSFAVTPLSYRADEG